MPPDEPKTDTPKPEAVDLDAAVEAAKKRVWNCANVWLIGHGNADCPMESCVIARALLRTARRVEEAERRAEKWKEIAAMGTTTLTPDEQPAYFAAMREVGALEALDSPSPTPNHGG